MFMIITFLYLLFLHVFGWLAVPLAFYSFVALFFKKTSIHGLSIITTGLIAGGICFTAFWLIAIFIVLIKGEQISRISTSFGIL